MPDTTSPYDDDVVDPYSADDTKNPHEETSGGDEEAEGEEEDQPVKRKPGRPRKTAS